MGWVVDQCTYWKVRVFMADGNMRAYSMQAAFEKDGVAATLAACHCELKQVRNPRENDPVEPEEFTPDWPGEEDDSEQEKLDSTSFHPPVVCEKQVLHDSMVILVLGPRKQYRQLSQLRHIMTGAMWPSEMVTHRKKVVQQWTPGHPKSSYGKRSSKPGMGDALEPSEDPDLLEAHELAELILKSMDTFLLPDLLTQTRQLYGKQLTRYE